MTTLGQVARQRLHNQRLIGEAFEDPEQVVAWLGAVQAQDYAGAKWALGLRLRACRDEDVEQALQSGKLLRTHVLRPTWHFVCPADIRFMLALSAPRVRASMAYYDRKLALDEGTFARANQVLCKALEGQCYLTREQLAQRLASAGIQAEGQRLGHLLMRAELEALICSGPRRGKQHTYALLDERVPAAPARDYDAALTELTRRYFASHGPAQVHDFAWWSGLSVTQAKRGIDLAQPGLNAVLIEGASYWSFAPEAPIRTKAAIIHLLPNYDEHLIAYKDHRAGLDPQISKTLDPHGDVLSHHIITMSGRVIGGFRRTIDRTHVEIEVRLLVELTAAQRKALEAAAARYGAFISLPVRMTF